MKVVYLDYNGKPAPIDLEEFEIYKVVVIKNRYYVWKSGLYSVKHVDMAEKFTNGDLSKVRAAGSFSVRPDNKLNATEFHSTSIAYRKINAHMTDEGFSELASMLGLTVEDFGW